MKKIPKTPAIILSVVLLMLWSISPKYTGDSKFISTIVINGNKIIDDNFVLSEGLISPGNSPGKITITGDFSMGSSATYRCELKDLSGAGSGHDQIDVSGSITLDGALSIVLDGYTPNDDDMFEIMKYGNSINGNFSSITGMPTGWQIDYGVKVPNKVTIYGATSTLPVTLMNFSAKKRDDVVVLSWQTALERNSDYFNVEHSMNARDFSVLERVKAQGAGQNIHQYFFTHSTPAKGVNYYRLVQVDLDGKFVYSKIVSVDFEGKEVTFHPNPATSTIIFNKEIRSVTIYDLLGKEILRKEGMILRLDISGIEAGIYILNMNQGEYEERLIVE